MNFGQALEALKQGSKVARAGWNGKGMWLIKIDADEYTIESYKYFEATKLAPWIAMKTATGEIVPWLASQTDVLAEDWEIIK